MIRVRIATAADAEVISEISLEVHALHARAHPEIFKPAGPAVFPPAAILDLITHPDRMLWVAEQGGAVVGYAYAECRDEPENPWKFARRVMHVHQMCVRATHQRLGIGSLLFGAIRSESDARRAVAIDLNVWAFNTSAIAFYERQGLVRSTERFWLPITSDSR
jgi:diamine N-acetyltransferase